MNKFEITILIFLVVIAVGLVIPASVHAAEGGIISSMISSIFSWLGSNVADGVGGNILKVLGEFTAWLASWLLLAAGWLFDASLEYTIAADGGKNILDIPAIKDGWGVTRDVANMTFVFIFLYIAIATILQLSNFDTKRTLATLIVVALLINFSFFLTGVVIDAANILALIIYNGMTSDGTISISAQMGNALDVESVFTKGAFEKAWNYQLAVAHFLSAGVFLIASFVLLSGAILFILRTVVLMFLLVLSPIALAAMILPATKQHFNAWLHKLIDHSFVAPIFLLVLFIALRIATTGDFIDTKNTSFAGAFAVKEGGELNTLQIFLGFGLIIGLFVGALTVSRRMAGGVAELSVKYAGGAIGKAASAAGFVGRRTVGRASRALADSEYLKQKQAEGGVVARSLALGTREVGKYGAKASFDVRGSRFAQQAARGAGTSIGQPGGRGGFDETRKAYIERQKKTADELGGASMTGEERSKQRDLQGQLQRSKDADEQWRIKRELANLGKAPKERARERKEAFAGRLERGGEGPLMSAEAKRAAADKIRKVKDSKEKFRDMVKDIISEEGGGGSGGAPSGPGSGEPTT